MGKKNGRKGGPDLSSLNPLDPDDKQTLRVVIETPKGSRNKFAFSVGLQTQESIAYGNGVSLRFRICSLYRSRGR